MARKDSKGYNLYTGEFQRKDGRYAYSYTDRMGERHTIYKKSLVELREAEKKLKRDYDDGLDPSKAKNVEVNHMVEAYLDTKHNLKVTTKGTYVHMFQNYIKDDFGKRKIIDVKYSDVKKYEFKGKRVFTAEEYVEFSGTHCGHIVVPEPIRTEFFVGLRNAVLEAGDRIVFNDTYVLYLTKKPN